MVSFISLALQPGNSVILYIVTWIMAIQARGRLPVLTSGWQSDWSINDDGGGGEGLIGTENVPKYGLKCLLGLWIAQRGTGGG